jgi:hypothetical protein
MLEQSSRRGRIILLNLLEMGNPPVWGEVLTGLGNNSFLDRYKNGDEFTDSFSSRLSVLMTLAPEEVHWGGSREKRMICD